jgi:uncharacterized Zn finger protein
MGWYYDFPKAAPRPKAALGKERKKFGETRWGKKWVEVLSKYEHDQRMSRGRAYARANKVKKLKMQSGKILAKVNGSLGNYNVEIKFKTHSNRDWQKIIDKIRCTPLLIGKLLNNEMPEELETVTGYSFIPTSFSSRCSCPDYANPCKHIAAVFYTLADEIDFNPMSLFLLRGMCAQEIFSRMDLTDEPAEARGEKKAGSKKKAVAKKRKAR